MLAAAAGVDAATAQKIVAREFPNPTLSASSTMINVDHHPSSTPQGNGLWDRSYDTVFAINQLFELEANGATAKPQPRLGLKRPKPSSSMLSEHWIFPSQKRTWPLPRQKKMCVC